jgi:hypothetical protein
MFLGDVDSDCLLVFGLVMMVVDVVVEIVFSVARGMYPTSLVKE